MIHAAVGLDGGAVNGVEGIVGEEAGEVGDGGEEFDLEGVVVEGADADFLPGDATGVEIGRAADAVVEVGVAVAEGGGKNAAPSVAEVVGGDGVAVGPAGVGAEVESVGEVVGGNIPAGGDAGDGGEVGGVVGGEAFEEGAHQAILRHAGNDVGIEVFGLGAVANEENLIADAGSDSGLTASAGGEEKGDG